MVIVDYMKMYVNCFVWQCSSSCGDGVQFRRVSCVGGMKCRDAQEPESIQQCRSGCANSSTFTPLSNSTDVLPQPQGDEITNDIINNEIETIVGDGDKSQDKQQGKQPQEQEEQEQEKQHLEHQQQLQEQEQEQEQKQKQEKETIEDGDREKRPDYSVEDVVDVDHLQVMEMQNVTFDPSEMDSNDIELSDEGFKSSLNVKKMSIHLGEDAVNFLQSLQPPDDDGQSIDVSKIKPQFNWKIGLWTKVSSTYSIKLFERENVHHSILSAIDFLCYGLSFNRLDFNCFPPFCRVDLD